MLSLEKIMTELNANSVNEVVGGRHGNTKTRNRTKTRTRHHHHHTHRHHGGHGRH